MFTLEGGGPMANDHLVIKPKGDDSYKVFSIRVKEQTLQRIEEISAHWANAGLCTSAHKNTIH